jgi:hypothetical protein
MARNLWPGLEPVLGAVLSELSALVDNLEPVNGKALPSSFGPGQRQNGSPRKPDGIPIKNPETELPFGFRKRSGEVRNPPDLSVGRFQNIKTFLP